MLFYTADRKMFKALKGLPVSAAKTRKDLYESRDKKRREEIKRKDRKYKNT